MVRQAGGPTLTIVELYRFLCTHCTWGTGTPPVPNLKLFLDIKKLLLLPLGREGRNYSRGPNSSTLLIFYGNYVEFLLHLDKYLVTLRSVKERCILK